MDIRAIAIRDVDEAPKLWQEIVDASEDGWIWHTWAAHEYNLCAGQKFAAVDHSFFIYQDGKSVGVVPLTIQEKSTGDAIEREAAYYSGFLPWPCFRHDVHDLEKLEDFACEELMQRARTAGARRIKIRFTPPRNSGNEETRIGRVATKYAFQLNHFDSHVVSITDGTLDAVRERYRRYHKKYSPLFTLSVAEGAAVTPELEETYFRLHMKDAGGQFRSRESYTKLADIARQKESFYVIATHLESGIIAGMLLVMLYKHASYDGSVAVDPDFADRYVSHLLKWRAIEELQKSNVTDYELGPKAEPGSATQKELGISHFKEGWSRGHTRTVWELEKFLDTK